LGFSPKRATQKLTQTASKKAKKQRANWQHSIANLPFAFLPFASAASLD
jgi:hypothetical protein